MKTPFAALAAAGLAMTAAPTLAQDAQSVHVSYADLNLASPEGQKRLDRRIDNAAREVCGYHAVRSGTRIPDPKARACFDRARANAQDRVAAAIEASALGG
ncbi:UrcA family protein [Qipengyuania sp. 6B39]|uniref:UrcA family protein n=1 Tax=Qipengyuania proteolytica TaxID=2867239 RepID=UPI001C88ED33|nr:UrcA family protein [Qipengyuania proteolytica]MBX7494653.1 UrcA family protein [Qipengyuania proteolytica]